MGMYTELVCSFDLKKSTPQNVIDILKYMTSLTETCPSPLPEHRFFSTTRWDIMLCCDSCYFPGKAHSCLDYDDVCGWSMSIKCNLKNYDGEIEAFVDWIRSYIDTTGFFGYMRYEEWEVPTLLYNGKEGFYESAKT